MLVLIPDAIEHSQRACASASSASEQSETSGAPQYNATMSPGVYKSIIMMVFLAASFAFYTVGALVIPDSDPFSGGAQRLPSELQTTGTKRSDEAYVTVLYGEFLLGVRVLGQSLKQSQTERDRIVLCAPDVPDSAKEVLAKDGWIVGQKATKL